MTKKIQAVKTPAQRPSAPKGADKVPPVRDAFGFGIGTAVHEFGKMLLAEGGCTMGEVKKQTGQTQYSRFTKLVENGLAEKREDGRMYATDAARQGAKEGK